jgi:hypothetical protein
VTDYSTNYLKLQRLIKSYHNATLKGDFEKAMKHATNISEESIRLEIATLREVKKSWLN